MTLGFKLVWLSLDLTTVTSAWSGCLYYLPLTHVLVLCLCGHWSSTKSCLLIPGRWGLQPGLTLLAPASGTSPAERDSGVRGSAVEMTPKGP